MTSSHTPSSCDDILTFTLNHRIPGLQELWAPQSPWEFCCKELWILRKSPSQDWWLGYPKFQASLGYIESLPQNTYTNKKYNPKNARSPRKDCSTPQNSDI